MEVTLVHPDNKDGKVVVTNQIQYDAFKARGFVDVAEKESKDLKAAETQGLKAHPMADASKETPFNQKKADETADVDRKNAAQSSDKAKKETK